MLSLTEHDLEDLIIEHSPFIRKKIRQAEDDIKKGRAKLKKFIIQLKL